MTGLVVNAPVTEQRSIHRQEYALARTAASMEKPMTPQWQSDDVLCFSCPWLALVFGLSSMLGACTGGAVRPGQIMQVTMPAYMAWYQNERVFYITSDISDEAMGKSAGANYAPRLRDAVPAYPKNPENATVLERVYKFPGNEQDAVFGSAPAPIGPTSQNRQYSPLWLLYTVEWRTPSGNRVLTSEAAILDAEANGSLSVMRTDIVINCPIVANSTGQHLPNVVVTR